MQCSFCKEESIISYADMTGYRNVCKNHYKIKLIEDIESSEFIKTTCNKCNNGILLYRGLGVANDSVIVSFICSICDNKLSIKRKIESYFKEKQK